MNSVNEMKKPRKILLFCIGGVALFVSGWFLRDWIWSDTTRMFVVFPDDEAFVRNDAAIEAKRHGLDYVKLADDAVQGKRQALVTLLNFTDQLDGGGAIAHGDCMFGMLGLIGDEAFAESVRQSDSKRKENLCGIMRETYGVLLEHLVGVKVDESAFERTFPDTFAALAEE
ncbi:MAG: hypothetical protein HUU29_06385 [Planctomycetaceae bacterium]|nr:hypothetical protein [Planctomycetaceae bacterium]